MTFSFVWKRFSELSLDELYAMLNLRERVFVVEQKCAYLDVDYKDQKAVHLLAYGPGEKIPSGYLRLLPPGARFAEWTISRVVTAPESRKTGLGRTLMRESLDHLKAQQGGPAVRISAQAYLQKFYEDFGFEIVRGPYPEDDIPHYEMLRKAW